MHKFMRYKCLALLTLFCSGVAAAQMVDRSVESGTLVMAAKTNSSVIISVDNKVTPPRAEDLANPQTKMLDVGHNSACAVDGILYQPDNGVDIMRALRQWINAHQTIEIEKAFAGLGLSAEAEWNRGIHKNTDKDIDAPITSLTCGGLVDGHLAILRGAIILKPDQSAYFKGSETNPGSTLYMSGAFPDTEYFMLLIRAPEPPALIERKMVKPKDLEVRKDIRDDASAMNAIGVWQASPNWNQSDAKKLFMSVYTATERHFEEVGKPNNVRILSACGRLPPTTVEGDWPTCPPSKAPVTKRKQKSSSKVKGSKPSIESN